MYQHFSSVSFENVEFVQSKRFYLLELAKLPVCHQGNAAEDGRRNEISRNCKFFEKICNVGYPVSSVTLPQTKNKACREISSQKLTKDKS